MSTFEETALSQTKNDNLCKVCGKTFKRGKDLKSHFVIHSDLKPFVCNLCPEAFKHKASLKRHCLIHSGEKPFDCKICGKCFRQKGSLNEHLLTHTGEKPHSCEICCMGFTTRSNYLRHLRKHLNSKPYLCESCGKRFNVRSTLRRHYKIHVKLGHILSIPSEIERDCDSFDIDYRDSEGEKRSMEKQPSKVLVVNGEVKRVIESNKKMYTCKICKKQFHGHYYLKSHLLSHMNKKQYTCSLCSETFQSISTFCKHKLTHSQEQISNGDSFDKMIKICEDSIDKINTLQSYLKIHKGNLYDEPGSENTDLKKCFACNICYKTFEKEFAYIEHSFEHNITGPFECDICYDKRIFENLSELHEHYSRHDDVPCVCFLCNSSLSEFFDSSQNSECSFHKCSLCHKCFIDTALLQKHYAMHKSRRPYLVKLIT